MGNVRKYKYSVKSQLHDMVISDVTFLSVMYIIVALKLTGLEYF